MREIKNKKLDEIEKTCYHCYHFSMENDVKPCCDITDCKYDRTCCSYCPKEVIDELNANLPAQLLKSIESYKESYKKMKEGKSNHCFDCIAESLVGEIYDLEKEGKISQEIADKLYELYNYGGQYVILRI